MGRGEMINYINKLQKLALKYNSKDFHVFLRYSGHVNELDLDIYCGGWNREGKITFNKEFKTNTFYGQLEAFWCCYVLKKMYKTWKKNKTIWKPNKKADPFEKPKKS
jgi:hypothetical protein